MEKQTFKYKLFLYITMERKIDNQSEQKLKLQFITSDEVWDKVLQFKINSNLKNNNKAVEKLILKALSLSEKYDKTILSDYSIPEDTLEQIEKFRNAVPTFERKHYLPLEIFFDKKSKTYYTECHVLAEDFIKSSDPDIMIEDNPDWEDEQRANRELDKDNYYFIQMVEDANLDRSFSDLIVEYYLEYKSDKPLKILGGQHRDEAIKMAIKEGNQKEVYHGIKVYFNLDRDARYEIMRIANTNINVSNDLRDRLQEETLSPTGMLKEFARKTGMLKEDENFSDKRKYEKDFSPSVRIVRSFIVNFFKGKNYKGEIDEDAVEPYLCKSGKQVDFEYIKYFKKFKDKKKFDDLQLIEAGKLFAKLHDKQFEKADKIKISAKKEFKIKSFSLAIITSWAFASGVLQTLPKRLKKLYDLPDLSGDDDPLNAKAMTNARHKIIDADKNYRGLGTRSDTSERGRLLYLFLAYSDSPKPKITEQMCNNAIEIFHSNKDKIKAEENKRRAFG